MSAVTSMRAEISRLRLINAEMLAALKALANDVDGAWTIGEPGIREAIGHTNYHVVRDKLDQARAAIAKAEVRT